jgi:hypothetical protein
MKKWISTMVLLGLILVNIKSQIPTAGLVRHYPLDGNANDLGPNAANGSVYGAIPTSDRFGNLNSAYAFNGITDYVDMPVYPTYVNSLMFSEYTYSAWVLTQSVPNFGVETYVIAIGDGAGQRISTGNISAGFCNSWKGKSDSYTAQGLPVNYSTCDNTNLTLNVWKHLTITRSSNALKLYIDGLLNSVDSTIDTTYPYYAFPDYMTASYDYGANIGSMPYGVGGYFHGKIDDVLIYDRALTAAEVLAIHNTNTSSIINMATKLNRIQFFPNPANASVSFEYPVTDQTTLNIYDLNGNLIKSNSLNRTSSQHSINVEDLSRGVYLCKIVSKDFISESKKLVISR